MRGSPPGSESVRLPRHIAIVMDGNGRWAEQRNRPRTFGHRAGAKAVRRAVHAANERGVEVLTLFAFSSENWARPASEVSALMSLFLRALDREIDELDRNRVRLRFIGDRAAFAPALRLRMDAAEQRTAAHQSLNLVIAANYGGRWDIVQAARRMAEDTEAGKLRAAEIDSATLASYLSIADLPEPDLFIRTGGDQRISNFLLWQIAYAELVFLDVLWPDFDSASLDQALAEYGSRERRFGKTGSQVAHGGQPC